MTPELLAEIEARHCERPSEDGPVCVVDWELWPCDTAAVLQALAASREREAQAVARAEAAEAALRDLLKAQHGAPIDRMVALQEIGKEPFDFYTWAIKTHAAYDVLDKQARAALAGAEQREGR